MEGSCNQVKGGPLAPKMGGACGANMGNALNNHSNNQEHFAAGF